MGAWLNSLDVDGQGVLFADKFAADVVLQTRRPIAIEDEIESERPRRHRRTWSWE